MPLITRKPDDPGSEAGTVYVAVDRHTLMKRRWRATADDGTDLAVDLEEPCRNGDLVFMDNNRAYRVSQDPEPVLRIRIPHDPEEAARLGWFLGNQHLPVQFSGEFIQLAREEHLAKRLERLGIQAESSLDIFSPDPHSAVHHHHH